MPRVGFEPTTPVFERAKTVHVSDSAANVTVTAQFSFHKYDVYPHVRGDYRADVWTEFKSPAQWPTSPFMLWFNSTGHGPICVSITTYNKPGDEVMTYPSQGRPRHRSAVSRYLQANHYALEQNTDVLPLNGTHNLYKFLAYFFLVCKKK
jgi:hypothetical protein